MERKRKTRTQLAQTVAEKSTAEPAQKTQQSQFGCCFCVTKTSCLVCHQSSTRQSNTDTPQSSCSEWACKCKWRRGGGVNDFGNPSVFMEKDRQKTGLETLFVRSMQQMGQNEYAALLHFFGEALFHLFNQLKSPQFPKSTTIFSSHGCAMRGKLANDANKFLTLLYGTRLFSLGGEDAVRDTHLVEDMRKEMNGWRGEGRAAVEGGDEARGTAEQF
ncbi:uncharacterized protein MONOS_5210 [Monocercomonoides exilis]|uniref:uncharacterized protein n=1 Tax=Monocercomonoides exilis TaxID=2049356 RepID=UPI003559EBB9|nr:hypothetical protein MONOS_5210 [Monocercomonoides exilis]|eukprot:MONOS_5210.1-p1 / transcript=MONOS_5210.1 / gene=MONOS_5210 / organism=Monocercomonoides_exilis_PA203 / gene_product=unspecified product / transcript_product=unspecified product / location=Mono_scaffold00149:44688-45382(+) / protein_length=217 / sequence_SO=supercontig / SO=protein_coding / is_pseudo=false